MWWQWAACKDGVHLPHPAARRCTLCCHHDLVTWEFLNQTCIKSYWLLAFCAITQTVEPHLHVMRAVWLNLLPYPANVSITPHPHSRPTVPYVTPLMSVKHRVGPDKVISGWLLHCSLVKLQLLLIIKTCGCFLWIFLLVFLSFFSLFLHLSLTFLLAPQEIP